MRRFLGIMSVMTHTVATPEINPHNPLVVGFDLDLTLAHTSEGIIASFWAAVKDLKIRDVDFEGARDRLGDPIQDEFRLYLPEAEVEPAVEIFREHMETFGKEGASLLPGAAESIAKVRELGGFSLVLTTKQTSLATDLLDHLGLEVDQVIGGMHGNDKRDALIEAKAWGYVGDHVKDIRAARSAGAVAVGVTTGNHTEEALWNAGADFVLATLEDLPPLIGQPVVR